jgi:hypothetical protein
MSQVSFPNVRAFVAFPANRSEADAAAEPPVQVGKKAKKEKKEKKHRKSSGYNIFLKHISAYVRSFDFKPNTTSVTRVTGAVWKDLPGMLRWHYCFIRAASAVLRK